MGARREDVDLELVLRDPLVAREWVRNFNWEMAPAPKYVVFGIDQKIYLDKMADDEAVMAAFILLHDVEIPRTMRQLQYERDVH